MKRITTILTAILVLCFAAVSWGATLEGVTVTGAIVNPPAPVNSWDLAYDLIDRTGNIHGTETHAGTNRTFKDPDNNGQITDAAAHAARFENVGGFRALLIEPAGTNLIEYSHEFDDPWWTKGANVTITPNDMTGPDGNITADKYSISQVTARSIASGDITVDANGKTFTFSFYYYATSGTTILFKWQYNTSFTESTYANQELIGDSSWHRFIITETYTQATTDICVTFWDDSGNIGDRFWFYGAQLEESPVPTSLIHTSGGTETRATESGEPHFLLPTGLFDEKGTAIVWWRPGYSDSDSGSVNSGIVNTRDSFLGLFYTYGGTLYSNDASNHILKFIGFTANTWYKLIVKWGYLVGGDLKYRVGADTGSGVSWGVEATFDGAYGTGTDIRLGYDLFSRMHIRGLRLYKDVLTDIEIDRE